MEDYIEKSRQNRLLCSDFFAANPTAQVAVTPTSIIDRSGNETPRSDEHKFLRQRVKELEAELSPQVCCQDFANCQTACLPMGDHWRAKAAELEETLMDHKAELAALTQRVKELEEISQQIRGIANSWYDEWTKKSKELAALKQGEPVAWWTGKRYVNNSFAISLGTIPPEWIPLCRKAMIAAAPKGETE